MHPAHVLLLEHSVLGDDLLDLCADLLHRLGIDARSVVREDNLQQKLTPRCNPVCVA